MLSPDGAVIGLKQILLENRLKLPTFVIPDTCNLNLVSPDCLYKSGNRDNLLVQKSLWANVKSMFLGIIKHKTYAIIMIRTYELIQNSRGTFNNKDVTLFMFDTVFCFSPLNISTSSSVIIAWCHKLLYLIYTISQII